MQNRSVQAKKEIEYKESAIQNNSWKMTNQSKSMLLGYSSSKHSRCQQYKSKCQYIQQIKCRKPLSFRIHKQ